MTTAFIWKDKNSKEVWPTFATDTYASDAMTIYGFSIEYSLSGNDASSFVKPTISDNKLKLTDAMAKLSMNNANLVVTVKLLLLLLGVAWLVRLRLLQSKFQLG